MSVNHLLFSVLDAYKAALLSSFSEALPELSLLYFRVLRMLERHEEVTPLQIAQLLHRDKGQVTRLLSELIQKSWLVKVPHPQDKRSVLVQLTPEGKQVLATAQALEASVSATMTAGMSAEQQRLVSQGLTQMQHNLKRN